MVGFSHSFLVRAGSALILAPIVLGIVWYGSWPFWGLVLIAFALCSYEGLMIAGKTSWALLLSPIVIIYLAVGMTAFVLLREQGPFPVFALLLAVWASDSGAYFAGKSIGGPKMAPTLSPNKTWAGLLGAVLGSFIAFYAFSFVTPGRETISMLLIVGIAIGLVGQVGDLMESALKRLARVKDSGQLIPGHGGLLDRIDALLLCAPVYLVILTEIF